MRTDQAAISVSECADLILATESAAVLTHIRPDGDTVGTAVALCRLFKALGKDAAILPSDAIPSRLAFLTEGTDIIDEVGDRTVIACDVASPAQLGELFGRLPRVDFSIDHHEVSTPFSKHLTPGNKSSTGEVLYDVICELVSRGAAELSQSIAYPLYAAISSDTGGFSFPCTSADTYRAAAALVETGIDHADINRKLFHSKSEDQIKAEGFISTCLRTSGAITYATVTLRDMQRLGLTKDSFETAIEVVRSLAGTKIAFVLKEQTEGVFRASLRSVGADVASVAAAFGGGGHIRAAGCSVSAESKEIAEKILLDALKCKL